MNRSRVSFSLLAASRAIFWATSAALVFLAWHAGFKTQELYDTPPGPRFAATDWIVWSDSSDCVVARQVLPPAQRVARLSGSSILRGDRLLAIDYLPVSASAMVDRLVLAARPGDVRLYRLAHSGDPKPRLLFVAAALRPSFLPVSGPWVNALMLVFYVFAALCIALLLAILYPFLLHHLHAQFTTLALLTVAGSYFIVQAGRLAFILLAPQSLTPHLEGAALLIALLLFCMTLALLAGWRVRLAFLALGAGLLGAWAYSVFGGWELRLWEPTAAWATAGFGVAMLGAFAVEQPRQAANGAWRNALVIGVTILLALHLILAYQGNTQYSPFGALAVGLGLLVAVGWSARQAILLGKVGEALARAILYLLLVLLSALLYVAVYRLTESWIDDPLWHALLPLGLFTLLTPIVLQLYRTREASLPRWFLTARRRRIEQLEELLARIPRFTHMDELLDFVEQKLQALLGVEVCTVWLSREEAFPVPEMDSESAQTRFWNSFDDQRPWWSTTSELNRSTLPADLELALEARRFALVVPMPGPRGALLVGRKARGMLTLEAAEHAWRVAQQLQLALEILQLLEQEKVLVEKTMEANLIALRSQINPHFLFNTFNSIADLIHTSPHGAEAALEKLAWIIRYTLKFSKDNFVDLGNEMTLVRTYLELEKIRFADRLTVVIEEENGLSATPMPAFVLQTIVENCIKHGVARVVYPGVVHLKVRRDDRQVVIWVYDNGPGIDLQRVEKGTGLRNIIERMHALYGRADLIKFENTGDGTAVTLTLPLD